VAATRSHHYAQRYLATKLPPGLLDSPPRSDNHHSANSHTATDTKRLCATLLTTPPAPVLGAPTPNAHPAVNVVATEEVSLGLTMRQSKRIAAQPPSSAKPAERGRDTKLKKMGIQASTEDPKAGKKQQLLQAFGGTPPDNADEVLSQLLAAWTKVA
jgi:hypothetical protein